MKLKIIITILFLLVSAYLVYEFALKKWGCRDGKCIKVFGGKQSKVECEHMCQQYKLQNRKQFIKNQRKKVPVDEIPVNKNLPEFIMI